MELNKRSIEHQLLIKEELAKGLKSLKRVGGATATLFGSMIFYTKTFPPSPPQKYGMSGIFTNKTEIRARSQCLRYLGNMIRSFATILLVGEN